MWEEIFNFPSILKLNRQLSGNINFKVLIPIVRTGFLMKWDLDSLCNTNCYGCWYQMYNCFCRSHEWSLAAYASLDYYWLRNCVKAKNKCLPFTSIYGDNYILKFLLDFARLLRLFYKRYQNALIVGHQMQFLPVK